MGKGFTVETVKGVGKAAVKIKKLNIPRGFGGVLRQEGTPVINIQEQLLYNHRRKFSQGGDNKMAEDIKDEDLKEAVEAKSDDDVGVADTQLTNLSMQELMNELYRRGRTPEDIMNQTNTPSATSSYIYALFIPNYIMSCNDNTSNPYGNVRIKQDSTTTNTKADSYLRDINSAGATNVTRQFTGGMSAYWTPNTTSQITVYVTVEMGNATGRIGNFGSGDHTNATALTLFEIGT